MPEQRTSGQTTLAAAPGEWDRQAFQKVLDVLADPRNAWMGVGFGPLSVVGKSKAFMPSMDRNWAQSTEAVKTEVLKKFMHFDREAMNPQAVTKIENAIAEHPGIIEPLLLQYFQPNKTALLGEGNHRLAAAIRLGLPEVPVRVLREEYGRASNLPKWLPEMPPRPVPGIEPNEFGYVRGSLKPSEIGIEGTSSISPLRMRLLKRIEPLGFGE